MKRDKYIQKIGALISSQNYFFEELKSFETSGVIKNLRLLGTILAFEVHTHEEDGYLHNIGADFTKFCLQNGVYLRAMGNTIYVMPPYCIRKKELEKTYDVIKEFLNSLIKKN